MATTFSLRRVLAAIAVLALFTAVSAGARPQGAAAFSLGNKCTGVVHFRGDRDERLTLVHESKWDSDTWLTRPPHEISDGSSGEWTTEGGAFRGCHSRVMYHVTCSDRCPFGVPFVAKLGFSETFHWDPSSNPEYDCNITDELAYARGLTSCYAAHELMSVTGLAADVAVIWNARQFDP